MKNKLLIVLLLITSLFVMTGCSLFKFDDIDSVDEVKDKDRDKKAEIVINDFYKYIADKDVDNLSKVFSLELINEFSYFHYEKDDLAEILNDETVSDKLVLIEPTKIVYLNDMHDVDKYIKSFNITWFELSEFGFRDSTYYAYNVKGKRKDTGEEVSDLIYIKNDLGKYKVTFSYLFFQDFK